MRYEAAGIELDGIESSTSREVTALGHMRCRRVRVRFLIDPERDPKALVRLASAIAQDGPIAGPGLVTVLEAAPDADPPYVVEDPQVGPTLVDATPRLAPCAHGLAAALAILAERGLVHGAIDPTAVIVTPDGGVKLGGLGRARATQEQEPYAAPEALGGRAVTGAADVYAVALLLCEVAAGRALFAPEARERVTPEMRLAGWMPPPAVETALGPVLGSAVAASLDLKPALRPRPEWLVNAAARAVPRRVRYPFAIAPVALFFALLVFGLVFGAMRDMARPPSARRTPDAVPTPAPAPVWKVETQAERHVRREEYREAEALLRPHLASRRAFTEILYANALEGLGRHEEARRFYERALEKPQLRAFAHLRLGRLCHNMSRTAEAIAHTRQALELSPGYGCARLQLAWLAPETDGLALELASNPTSGHAASHLGHALWSRERFTEAERYLRSGCEPLEEVPGSHMELALFLEETGRRDEALRIAESVAAAVPRADAFALIARLRAADQAASGAALQRALALDPYTANDLAEVARTLIRANSTPERARTLLMRALEIEPHSHRAWEDLAVVQYTLGDRETAKGATMNALREVGRCGRCSALLALASNTPLPAGDTAMHHYARAVTSRDPRDLAKALALEPGNLLFTRLAAELAR